MDIQDRQMRSYTANDIDVGAHLYEALVAYAAASPGAAIYYADLLALARSRHPLDAVLARAVPVGIGMKLLFVDTFCRSSDYPNLACLAMSRSRNRPGPGYQGDWEKDKREVAAFDWSKAQAKFPDYVRDARNALPPQHAARRSETAARELLFVHYRADRARYASISLNDREELVNLLMAGMDEEEALVQVLADKAMFDHDESVAACPC